MEEKLEDERCGWIVKYQFKVRNTRAWARSLKSKVAASWCETVMTEPSQG